MNITTVAGQLLRIENAAGLDPITVVLEDLSPRRGNIIIKCWDKAWTAYWGGMGERSIAQFFAEQSPDYLVRNLQTGIEAKCYNPTDVGAALVDILLRKRRARKLDAEQARDLYDDIDMEAFSIDPWVNAKLFKTMLGDEWFFKLPQTPNPDYRYLHRLVVAVQAALQQYLQLQKDQQHDDTTT